MQPERRSRLVAAIVVAVWLATLALPPVILAVWRTSRLAELSRPEVQAEWDTFRAAMREQSGRAGPVQRKVPKSPEPPELVWLRDYFGLAVTAWVALVGVLGGFLGLLVLGVTAGRRGPAKANGPGSAGP
jgi:hypothetical protein